MKRIGIVLLALCLSLPWPALAAQAPAGQASQARIDQLLQVMRARDTVEEMLPQMEQMQKQVMAQAIGRRQLTAEQQASMERVRQIMNRRMRDALAWDKLEPLYRDIYAKSFNDEDMDAMIAFYGSPPGQRVLDKMPGLTQNTMSAIQQMLVPLMQDMERDIDAELDKQGDAPGEPPAVLDTPPAAR